MTERKTSDLSLFFHELKSPINAIINVAKLLELSLTEMDKDKIKNYISLLLSQAVYMKNLISNTLEIGKIQSGKTELFLEEFDIVELLYEIYEWTKILVATKPIEIVLNCSVKNFSVYSDPIKLKQILLNITSNAVKFTDRGFITITLVVEENFVKIVISDTGKGIKNLDTKSLFQPYCSLDSFNKKMYDSTGLGLYISKSLIDLIGGKISIESEYGRGTTVSIRIPKKFKA